MRLPKWLSLTPVIAVLVIVLLVVSTLQIIQWRKRRLISAEIEQIKQQQAAVQQKNKDLESSLSLLNTTDYKEKIAREQLNLKKEGEIVVNFPMVLGAAENTQQIELSNSQKWWQYFFNHN